MLTILGTIFKAIVNGITFVINWGITHWKIALTAIGLIIVISLGLSIYRCTKPTQRLTDKETLAAEKAIRDADAEKQREILAENDKLVASTQANNDNAEQRSKEAELKTAQAQQEIKDAAKRDYGSWTDEEVQQELERRAKAHAENH